MRYKRTMTITAAIAITILAAFALLRDTRRVPAQDEPVTGQQFPERSGENAIARLKENGQFESLDATVTAARYEAGASATGAAATNYDNQMRGVFTPAGVCLASNTSDAQWRSCWRLQSIGHGNNQLTVGEGEVETTGNRVTISHTISTPDRSAIADPQSLIINEWFNNSPGGLEHGFTLQTRLSESTETLRLTIVVNGDLAAQADPDGQTLRLINNQGEAVLNYEKLKVWDADGLEIAARMTTENGAVILDVDDAAAKYPLVIDPTFSAAAKLVASDGAADASFGNSVAISGDTTVVAADEDDVGGNFNQGSIYIFVRGSNGLWTQQAKLTAGDGAAQDYYGRSVGISGDTVVVGSYNDEVGGNIWQGSAYVYVRNGGVWTLQEKLYAGDGAAGDHFGQSVSISGDSIIVGAYENDIGGENWQGAAYVFVRSGTTWTQQQRLTAADGASDDHFGNSVAIQGNSAIVGAYFDDFGSETNQGSAYVFTRSGTTWTQQQKLSAIDGTGPDNFGYSVDIATAVDTVIVGSPQDGFFGVNRRGSAYVFTRSGTTWTQQDKLIASDSPQDDSFGLSVAINANTAIVGAYDDTVGANYFQGSAYVFTRSVVIWTERQKLTAFDGTPNDYFGYSVALSNTTAVVGSRSDDVGTNSGQGSAHIFRLGSKPFDFDEDGKADISIYRPGPGEWWYQKSSNLQVPGFQFGTSTDKIVPGDYTGDGKTDIAVWRPSNGFWYVLRSEDFLLYGFPFGTNGDIPVPGDYDGDGKTDAAVFRPSTLTWVINKSSGGVIFQTFGAAGDKPVVADYDGDGKTDIAIYRPSVGEWWYQRSSDGVVPGFQFGSSTDKPVQGDYTGDGKADIAIWRPSNGFWYVLRSEDFLFYAFPWGLSTDVPAPGDFDGDGKTDASVFRPSDTVWYINRSTAGVFIQQFGAAADLPVPSAFIP